MQMRTYLECPIIAAFSTPIQHKPTNMVITGVKGG